MNDKQLAAAIEILEKIANDELNIETLETQMSDRLDFHEVSVWSLKAAMLQAYGAGMAAGKAGK